MPRNNYVFVTHWTARGTCEEVADIFEDAGSMGRWWTPVCRDVRVLERGTGHGYGKVVSLATRGFLPVIIRWQFRVVEEAYPHRSRFVASGDFVGTGEWTFVQDGPCVNVTYDWRVRVEQPFMRRFGALLRPLFAVNHHWAMRKGESGLRRELERRRAGSNLVPEGVPLS